MNQAPSLLRKNGSIIAIDRPVAFKNYFFKRKIVVKTRVAINACGLHTGGGIQVAVSFLDELSRLEIQDLEPHIFVSSEIDNNLRKINSKICLKKGYKVINTYGISAFFSKLNRELKNFPLVFTIFGPNYLRSQKGIQIVGFAQLWITDKSAYHILNLKDRIKLRIKFFLQSLFFRRADRLIVELEHVKASLINAGIAKEQNIYIAHNCISSLYLKPSTWEPLPKKVQKKKYTIGYIGRDYPHKNTQLLPVVNSILKSKYAMDVDFCVTFSDAEWSAKSAEFKESILNVGSLSLAQCPTFYDAVDAVIFPSLLECFSATPLEAMAMKKPLFASDRGFVRDVCGNFAFYFDPLDPESAADVIAKYINNRSESDELRLTQAREHVLNFSSARGRAECYLEIIRKALAERVIGY